MKPPMSLRILLPVIASILVASCSPMSKNVRQEVKTEVPFDAMRQNPEAFIGKRVMLGGHILEVRNLPRSTQVTVLQTPLGFQDRPESKEQTQGRFVVVYEGFLDPAVYEKDRLLTVAGTVQGRETIKVDGYSYPAIAIKPIEMHLWEKEERRRPYPYYDPYFYDPFYPWPYYRDPFFRMRPWPRRW